MIGKPYTLADIPPDFISSSGRILVEDVHAVAGFAKKKRSEIAVAIDHQGVNIYDVQLAKLTTSYAVSPQAVFTCPPCSVRHRRQGSQAARRYTYCSLNSPKPHLLCFSETSPTRSDPKSNISVNSVKLKGGSPVVTLDTINVFEGDDQGSQENKLLAIHGDGTVTCYSHDLASEEWSTQDGLIGKPAATVHVEHAVVLSLEQCRKSILKSREDILASLTSPEREVEGSILLLITRPTRDEGYSEHKTLIFQIFYLEPRTSEARNLAIGTSRQIKELISMSLPEPRDYASQSSKFFLHVSTGTMYQTEAGKVAVYDLTGLVPRLAHNIDLGKHNRTSCLRLSANLLACSSVDSLSIIDLPYLSLQAQTDLKNIRDSKIREDDETSRAAFDLVSFYAPLNLAIALDGRKLLAIQLSTSTSQLAGTTKKRKRDGLLINALGRGSASVAGSPSTQVVPIRKIKSFGQYLPQLTADDSWIDQVAGMDRCCSQGDASGFLQSASSLIGLATSEGERQKKGSRHRLRLDQRKAHCLISRIFSVKESEHKHGREANNARNGLTIRLLPRKIFDVLVEHGVLDVSHIESSLRLSGDLSCDSELAPGALVQALADWDTSLGLLSSFLASSAPLSSAELVRVLAIVTRNTDASHSTASQKLSINGDRDSDEEVQMLLTNEETVQNPSSPPSVFGGNDHTHPIFTLTMKKLYAIPPPSVARALRSGLSITQLRLLVDGLRMEIARSGWLSPYEDSLEAVDSEHQDNHRICYIAHLLNCAIDSIGIGGWIFGTSITDELAETSDTLAYMKAEISAALEGIEEATYLKGMLGEILLCGKGTLNSHVKTSQSDEAPHIAVSAKPLTIPLEEVSNALPLGLKPREVLSFTKVGAGGELMKRSARDIGRQKSRKVGKYSFERIAI